MMETECERLSAGYFLEEGIDTMKSAMESSSFVEPDEKQLGKRRTKQQLAVFAAGPFSNVILAFCILGIFAFAGAPLVEAMVDFDGIQIVELAEGDFPAQSAGMEVGEVIQGLEGITLTDASNFSTILKTKKPGDTITVSTNKTDYQVTLTANPKNASIAFIGLSAKPKVIVKDSFKAQYGDFTATVLLWFIGLFYWLFLLNLGIGLFNLVPLGPIDGGRMFRTVTEKFVHQKKANRICLFVSFFVLSTIILNIAFSIFG